MVFQNEKGMIAGARWQDFTRRMRTSTLETQNERLYDRSQTMAGFQKKNDNLQTGGSI